MITWSAAIAVLVILALTVGHGGYVGELVSRVTETGAPVPVHDLTSIDTLQQAFNDGSGKPRLILLVSPT